MRARWPWQTQTRFLQCNRSAIEPVSGPAQWRSLHDTAVCSSGHSRWSKIKHDKGKNDARMNLDRARFAHDIVTTVKLFGGDVSANPRLADIVAKAKRAGFPKTSIESAIARGQGRSANGKPLEALTVEAIMPGNIGVMIECETENRLGVQADINSAIKKCGGVSSPSAFLFTKRGRVMFDQGDLAFDDIFEQAIDVSALDVFVADEGRVTIVTEHAETKRVAEALSKSLNIDPSTIDADISWLPNEETESALSESGFANQLMKLADMLHGLDPGLQAIHVNATQGSLSDQTWLDLKDRIAR